VTFEALFDFFIGNFHHQKGCHKNHQYIQDHVCGRETVAKGYKMTNTVVKKTTTLKHDIC